jgi:hypothetical protein
MAEHEGAYLHARFLHLRAAERTRRKQEKLEKGGKLSKNQKKRLKQKLKKQVRCAFAQLCCRHIFASATVVPRPGVRCMLPLAARACNVQRARGRASPRHCDCVPRRVPP